jgi:hypothetical protein
MNTNAFKGVATTLIPAALLALSGCGTPPVNPLATQNSPSFAGGRTVIQTYSAKGVVTDVVPAKRGLGIRASSGTTTSCKVAPEVADFSQVQTGSRVKACLTDEVAIFLVKNGPPPSAGAGVAVTGAAEAGQPASVVLLTTDSHAKVINVDRSYRLLKLQFDDGSRKEYKVALPDTLLDVQKGDEAIVRITEPLAICLKSK